MSGSWPDDIPIVSHKIGTQQQTLTSVGQSLKRQARSKNTQIWKVTLQTAPLKQPQWQKLLGFFNLQKGRYDTFTYVSKVFTRPLGTGAGTPLVNGASQVGGSLITDGWGASQTILKQGDFFKLAGSTKVYQIVSDAVSDGSGNATLAISPQLLSSPANNESLILVSVPFTVSFSNDLLEFDVDEIKLSGATIDLEEVF